MTVTVSKPQLNLREELSALKKKSGVKGEEILRASTVSDVYNIINPTMFRNRLINGDIRFDQRYAGASSGQVTNGFGPDRWRGQFDSSRATLQRVTDAPSGFVNSLKVTCTTASTSGQSFIVQSIEGYNFADFAWGTSSAANAVLSFWVKSSIAGVYTATLEDSAGSRCYSAPYSINLANIWEYKTIVVPGETSGIYWNKTNGNGVQVIFDLGSSSTQTGNVWGTSDSKRASGAIQFCNNVNATFQITGVQLEKGTVATPFEFRQAGSELALCQRYFEKSYEIESALGSGTLSGAHEYGVQNTGWQLVGSGSSVMFRVPKRTSPSMSFWDTAGTSQRVGIRYGTQGYSYSSGGLSAGSSGFYIDAFINGWPGTGTSSAAVFQWAANAEVI